MATIEYARHYVDQFSDLFRGNQSCYGQHFPERNVTKGKKSKGKSITIKKAITQEHFLKHLLGDESIGIVPLDINGNVRFAVIDVDIYDLSPIILLKVLSRANLPLVGFRSKSGGLHLYLFLMQDTKAAALLPLMRDIAALLGLDKATEIFPKQTRLVSNQAGSWINLPYYKFKETERYALDLNGNPLSIKDALKLCMTSKTNIKELTETLSGIPLAKAPPCLQTIFVSGGADEGFRNVFLFNCATYLKAKFGKEFAEQLHDLNSKTENAVAYEELDKTIISSHNKGDYSYQCSDQYLAKYCNKELCSDRKYGKGAGTVSDLSFEQLIQVNSSTPYYVWYVNGAKMMFYTEQELISQSKFRELCLRLLHKVPNTLKPESWNNILNRALSNIKIEDVDAEDDLSEDSLWLHKVAEFFQKRKALRPSQIEEGLAWMEMKEKQNLLFFKGAKLLEYLENCGLFRHFKKTQHRNMLNQLGAKRSKLRYSDSGVSSRVWCLNLTTLQKQGTLTSITVDIDEEEASKPLNFMGEEKY